MGKTDTKKIFILLKLQLGLICISFTPLISNYASSFPYNDNRFRASYCFILCLLFSYYYMWNYVLKKLPLSIAYSFRSTTIIWSLLWSYLFAGQTITATNIIGSIIIFSGILLIANE